MATPIRTSIPEAAGDIRLVASQTLPATDKLFSVGDGNLLLRVRVQRIVEPDQFESLDGETPRYVQASHVVYEVQVAPAADETGDVLKDDAGNNVLFAGERHTVVADGMSPTFDMKAWAAEVMFKAIQDAVRKSQLLAAAHFDDPFAGTAPTPIQP